MTASPDFVAFVIEQMGRLGVITTRRFFGGKGLYIDGVITAFIIRDLLYFKVDDQTRPEFEAEGSAAFTYETRNGTQTINGYYSAPDVVFDDQRAMQYFASLARLAAARASSAKPKKTAKALAAKTGPAKKPADRRRTNPRR